MKDIMPGAAGAFGRFLPAFLLPSAVAIGLFTFFVFPAVQEKPPFERVDQLSDAERLAALGLASLLLAFIAAIANPLMHAVLEGYVWPRGLSEARKRAFAKKANANLATVRRPIPSDSPEFLQAARKVKLYPADVRYVLPTALGNRISAAETYGLSRYGLDTPTLFYELKAAVGEPLASDVESSGNIVDSLVGAVFISMVFAACCGVVAVWGPSGAAVIAAIIALLVGVGSYAGAVFGCRNYINTVRALVDVGRLPLADKMGFNLPPSLAGERELWRATYNFVYWGPGYPDPWPNHAAREAVWNRARRGHNKSGVPPANH